MECLRASFLPKRMIERHHQRADDIIESGALDGRDHDGRRHARIELDIGHTGKLGLIDPHKSDVIGIIGLRVGQTVGRNLNDVAVNDRNDALLVCG